MIGGRVSARCIGAQARKSTKTGAGPRDLPISLGGALFRPGRELVSDADGIVVLP